MSYTNTKFYDFRERFVMTFQDSLPLKSKNKEEEKKIKKIKKWTQLQKQTILITIVTS